MARVPGDITTTVLVAGAAAAAPIMDINVDGGSSAPPPKLITVSTKVTVAALTGFEVWGRGDRSADYVPIASVAGDFTDVTGLQFSVRSDATADLTTTPAGVTATFALNPAGFDDIQVRAKSAGAAMCEVTYGTTR